MSSKNSKKKTVKKASGLEGFSTAELQFIGQAMSSVQNAIALPVCRSVFDKCSNEIKDRTPKKKVKPK